MKFIIRDDDVNYHYTVDQLSRWYSGIIDMCPISVCIPAFIKGDFFKWNRLAENHIPYSADEWLNDNTVYKLGDNYVLTAYLKRLLVQHKIGISMHGVSHRNDEMELEEVKHNYIRGAEFYTNRDYTRELYEAKSYLSELFGVEVCSFTPPQNMINIKGLNALKANNLSLCTDFLSLRNWDDCIKSYGIINYVKLCYYKLKKEQYPYVFHHHRMGFVRHCRLQPGRDIGAIKQELNSVYKNNGIFVLSTHSYGFDFKMESYNMTMKEALLDIIKYSKQFDNVEYTTLHDIFKKK